MKFEIGKPYKIRDGRKAHIFTLDNGTGSMFGAIYTAPYWIPCSWLTSGCFIDSKLENPADLISEWTEQLEFAFERAKGDDMTYNFCQKCFTRFDACESCKDAELAAKDKEIETLKAQIAAMRKCEICKHYDTFAHDAPCSGCADKTDLPSLTLSCALFATKLERSKL